MTSYRLDSPLTISELRNVGRRQKSITLPEELRQKLQSGHDYLIDHISAGNTVYGVNTGFGPLVENSVAPPEIHRLQTNLLQQLSGNIGPEVPAPLVRAVMTARARALSLGVSGVRPVVVASLAEMINSGITPVLRQFGSVGASGDLVPLSRIARTLTGEDSLRLPDGSILANHPETMQKFGLSALVLAPKEGLGLVNGTSYSAVQVAHALSVFRFLLTEIAIPVSLTLQVIFKDNLQHFHPAIYQYKAHPSAQEVAEYFRNWLPDTRFEKALGDHLQPPYSSRSIVLWFGTVLEHLQQAEASIETELNSVDDNPLIFPEENYILHAANFQGTYAAKAADDTSLGFAKLGIAVERQINRILHDKLNGELPAFLAEEPVGLHSGIQGFQLAATSLLADIRARAVPHGIQSIPTNADNQDMVSMSANAAHNAVEIAERMIALSAIFTATVARALQIAQPDLPAPLQKFWDKKAMADIDFSTQNLAEVLDSEIRRTKEMCGFF